MLTCLAFCLLSKDIRIEDRNGICLSVWVDGKRISEPEPIFNQANIVSKSGENKWDVCFGESINLKCAISMLDRGSYGELVIEATYLNDGKEAIDLEIPLPFSAWTKDSTQIISKTTQYLYLDKDNAIIGGIGSLLCHPLGGDFNNLSFVTMPSEENRYYIAACSTHYRRFHFKYNQDKKTVFRIHN